MSNCNPVSIALKEGDLYYLALKVCKGTEEERETISFGLEKQLLSSEQVAELRRYVYEYLNHKKEISQLMAQFRANKFRFKQ